MNYRYFCILLLTLSCTVSANIPTDPKQRFSSYPLISGDTFRAFCDFVFDETRIIFEPTEVFEGATVFVTGDYLSQFFTEIHPKIARKYILITHNSDHWIPGSFSNYLEDDHIIAWFSQNIDRTHPKLYALPIGIANSHWPHGNRDIMCRAIEESKMMSRRTDKLAYLNFMVGTNPQVRRPVWDFFVYKEFCLVSQPNKDFYSYLREMATCPFVISPPGNGIDCHRTWEALYVGTIPVVKASTLNPLYEGLPVIVIDDWELVTRAFLVEKLEEMNKEFKKEKLFADYWFEKINEIKKQYIAN